MERQYLKYSTESIDSAFKEVREGRFTCNAVSKTFIIYSVHRACGYKSHANCKCTSHVKCIDQPHQDLFSFESDNDEDYFCPECFLQGAR